MATIELSNMAFFAFHGCYPEEQVTGNNFTVDMTLVANTEKAEQTDDLNDTVNYQIAYNITKREMAIQSKLLEHVAARITHAVLEALPTVERIDVKVTKIAPTMGGRIGSVSITLSKTREA